MTDHYDIAVIGGGFGLALAREAAFHGFKTVLCEAGVLGKGTSANSLRIVHGGFRYLQNGAIGRLLSSARAQAETLKDYPELVTPLPCLMPLNRFGPKSRYPVSAALAVYHRLASTPEKRRGRVLGAADAEAASPALKGRAPYGALLWWDALVLDTDGFIETLRTEAVKLGAEIRQGAKAVSVSLTGNSATIITRAPDGEREIEARAVINASGPGIGSVQVPGAERATVKWCRGFNLLLRSQLDPAFAVAGHGRGRLLFAVPRDGGTAVGTWYLRPAPESADSPLTLTEQEIDSALEDVRAAFPGFKSERSELAGIETGILPYTREKRGEPEPLGQEYILTSGRYIEVVSTKFTTYRIQAARVLRALAPLLNDAPRVRP